MLNHGFVSNRVFDVLASCGFVFSDAVGGLSELFDGAVPVYRTDDDLENLVNYYLERPSERADLARKGRELVLESRTFDHRAREFDQLVKPLLASRGPLIP